MGQSKELFPSESTLLVDISSLLVAVNFVMGDGDSDYDYDYEPLDCTADDVYTCSSELGDACIPEVYVCDAWIDCEDGSDEADCGEGWEAKPLDELYDDDEVLRSDARRKATSKAAKQA